MTDTTVHTWSPEELDHMSIQLSDAAIAHIATWMGKDQNAIGLRFSVIENKGCSGFMYDVSLTQEEKIDDHMFTIKDITVFIDNASLPFLKGSHVDYVQEGINKKFKFTNPNESASCGCGESFSI